jgi:hypothetical protein
VNQDLAINVIRLDGETYHREGINYSTVREYAHKMMSGTLFPPINVFFDGDNYWLADGLHRIEATILTGKSIINTFITQGGYRDATFFGISYEDPKGLPHNQKDLVKCLKIVFSDQAWSKMNNQEIAIHCRTNKFFVNYLRKELYIS